MAKANLVLPDGTKVFIEGSAEEVATLLAKFSQPSGKKKSRKASKSSSKTTTTKRKGPQTLIAELAKEGFFKNKKTIVDIQKRLEEKGHIYSQESIGTPLLRLTKKRVIRRIKEKKGSKKLWFYVQ